MRIGTKPVVRVVVLAMLVVAGAVSLASPAGAQEVLCAEEPLLATFDADGDGVLMVGEVRQAAPDNAQLQAVADNMEAAGVAGIQYRGCDPGSGDSGDTAGDTDTSDSNDEEEVDQDTGTGDQDQSTNDGSGEADASTGGESDESTSADATAASTPAPGDPGDGGGWFDERLSVSTLPGVGAGHQTGQSGVNIALLCTSVLLALFAAMAWRLSASREQRTRRKWGYVKTKSGSSTHLWQGAFVFPNVHNRVITMMRFGRAIRRTDRSTAMLVAAVTMLLLTASPFAVAGQVSTPLPAGTPSVGEATPISETGLPRYPDLVSLPPDDLYFSVEVLADGRVHHLLRFSTWVANLGEGPLELAGSNEPGSGEEVYQVIRDATTGGGVVERRPLGTDLIYHPEHHHFHLDQFAMFELLREEPDGSLVTTGESGKQSSCLLDTAQVGDVTLPNAPESRQYAECELERQGLSVGWADVYAASLPDQWVDTGSGPLADGTYVLRYAVDPLGQLAEDGRTDNNVAETRFTVRDGAIVDRPEPPRCAIESHDTGPVGASVALRCSHFPSGVPVDVYWGEWDPWNTASEPVATFRSAGTDDVTVTFPVPDVSPGSYAIAVVAPDYRRALYVSATVIYGVTSGDDATPVATPAHS